MNGGKGRLHYNTLNTIAINMLGTSQLNYG